MTSTVPQDAQEALAALMGRAPGATRAATMEQRVAFAIRCVMEVCADSAWREWAERWLSGEDRAMETAEAAAWGAREVGEAWAAAWAARQLAQAEARATRAWATWALKAGVAPPAEDAKAAEDDRVATIAAAEGDVAGLVADAAKRAAAEGVNVGDIAARVLYGPD